MFFLLLLAVVAPVDDEAKIECSLLGQGSSSTMDLSDFPSIDLGRSPQCQFEFRRAASFGKVVILSCAPRERIRRVWPIDSHSVEKRPNRVAFTLAEIVPSATSTSFTLLLLRVPVEEDPITWTNETVLNRIRRQTPMAFADNGFLDWDVRQFLKFDVIGAVRCTSDVAELRVLDSKLGKSSQLIRRAFAEAQQGRNAESVASSIRGCAVALETTSNDALFSHPALTELLVQGTSMCIGAGGVKSGEDLHATTLHHSRMVYETRPSFSSRIVLSRCYRNEAKLRYIQGQYSKSLAAVQESRELLTGIPSGVLDTRVTDTKTTLLLLEMSMLDYVASDAVLNPRWESMISEIRASPVPKPIIDQLVLRVQYVWSTWLFHKGRHREAIETAHVAIASLPDRSHRTAEQSSFGLAFANVAAKSCIAVGQFDRGYEFVADIHPLRVSDSDSQLLLERYGHIAQIAQALGNRGLIAPHRGKIESLMANVKPQGPEQRAGYMFASLQIANAFMLLIPDSDADLIIGRGINGMQDDLRDQDRPLIGMAHFQLAIWKIRNENQKEAITAISTLR